jgi:aspartyl/asparaginyl beta-hydroxylase (cupin superfamily)
MRDLFIENFIDIPEEKLSIVESQFDEIEELTTQLNDVEKEKVALTAQVNEAKKDRILLSLSEDLAVTETEKFKELAENVDFESSELYEKKLIIIKEKYFPKDEKVSDLEETIPSTLSPEVSNNMAAYMAAISKNK